MKTEGNWKYYKKANPKKFNKEIKCVICNTKFKVTKEKNVARKDKNIHIETQCEWGGARDISERATGYYWKCPNCDHIEAEELFCVPTGEFIRGALYDNSCPY